MFKASAKPGLTMTAATPTFMSFTRLRCVLLDISVRRAYYLLFILALLTCFISFHSKPAFATDTIITAARVGLADHHTRITLESDQPIQYELSMLSNPGRVVVDLVNVTLNRTIKSLPAKIDPTDPFIAQIRYGRFKPHILRLVFDLKADVVPRTFLMEPADDHGYRLVLDIFQPDKAAIAEMDTNIKETSTGKNVDGDALGDLVASLLKKKPERQTSRQTSKDTNRFSPKSYQVAQYHKPTPPRTIIVAIDPGHGGRDPGAVGDNGTREKDITLAISRKLKTIIDKEPFMRAILTRDGDFDLPLKRRQEIARQQNADLFVSIHADGSPRPHAHGSSVYTLSEHGATSTTASWLAQKENNADSNLIGGVNIATKSGDMREIILDLSMSATISDSVKVAELVLNELGQINRLHKKTVEQAGFVVLKSPDIPSILVETAFITNPSEERKLKNQDYQRKMAKAIFGGIKNYFASNPALARTDVARAQ